MSATSTCERLPFSIKAEAEGLSEFLRTLKDPSTMQLNITKNCNLACKHCHVSSSPERLEEMDKRTLKACLDVFSAGAFTTLDITGGAPELNTNYRWLIKEASHCAAQKRSQGLSPRIITRTNAAILTLPEFVDLPKLWAQCDIEVAVSLPHYEKRMTDRMRGEGVFEKTIAGLRALNAVGYGVSKDAASVTESHASSVEASATSTLALNIVVNPGGAILPPSQASAEREYKKALRERYGITFDNLLVITNNPVGRFQTFLESRGIFESYLDKLYAAYNPATLEAAMCRDQISVDVDGRIFDCDFNQIEDMPILESCCEKDYSLTDSNGNPTRAFTIFDLVTEGVDIASPRYIRVDRHCYACTAGAGSSCGGSTT